MFCTQCGSQLPDDAHFCTKCGKQIMSQPSSSSQTSTQNYSPRKSANETYQANSMKLLACEMCGSPDLIKQDGLYVCAHCGMKYTVEEARKLMIEGTVDVKGTVKIDNSSFVEKYLVNARRALGKEDWEEVEKYYNMVEQNAPNNMEAVFFSSYGRVMSASMDDQFRKTNQKFDILVKSMSIISDCYETTSENKEAVLRQIDNYIQNMYSYKFLYARDYFSNNSYRAGDPGIKNWQVKRINDIRRAFITELNQIANKHDDTFIHELIIKNEKAPKSSGCYVATAVYGSYDCPQVWTLRRYRDYTLAESWYGRAFIHTYYAISPTLVKWFGHTEWFKKMWKSKLDRMVADLQAKGVEDTPYEDRIW